MARGRYFRLFGWQFFTNCHTRWSRLTSYRFYPNHGRPVRCVVVIGCELSWWRA